LREIWDKKNEKEALTNIGCKFTNDYDR